LSTAALLDRISGTREQQVANALTSDEATNPLSPLSKPALSPQQEMASRVLSRRRLLPFVQRTNDRYDAGWVHADICMRLEKFSDDVARGLSPRLMLLMPPRHGKSELASKNFPAWHLGRHPDHEFIACSYNLSLAMGFSRKVKQIMEDASYAGVFPNTKLDPNNQSTEEWGLANARGGYVAAGIGGPITGKGATCLVIDDPVKNAEEADSGDAREKIWEWYLSTAYSRLAPGGGVLIIQTWWHDDDLAGRIQQMMATHAEDEDVDQFEVVKYPAIATQDEYLDPTTLEIVYEHTPGASLLRSKGEALHPARYDIKKLNKIRALNRKDDGSDGRWWSALYQQNPVPDDGSYFTKDQFKRAPLPPLKKCNVVIAWDFAISEKKQNDYTVGTVLLQDSDDMLHVAEVVRFRSGDASFIVESILNLSSRWAAPSQVIGFEDGQIFRALKTLLTKRMRERKMYPSTEELKPITDKMARARAIQGRMQQGMVSFNETAEWYDTVRGEMLRFPAGVHDDCVDSLAWAAILAVGKEPPRKEEPKKMKSWRDKLSGGTGALTHMAA
jgi:predicted phage terminase large subunit-like protein